jgi:hypothetical protein
VLFFYAFPPASASPPSKNATLKHELAPLLAIRNSYEKLIITNSKTFVESYDGIRVRNAADWLCE